MPHTQEGSVLLTRQGGQEGDIFEKGAWSLICKVTRWRKQESHSCKGNTHPTPPQAGNGSDLMQSSYNMLWVLLFQSLVACELKLCSTPRDPVDCSPPGSSVHGIVQARILESIAISFSIFSHWGSSNIRGTEVCKGLDGIVMRLVGP